MNETGRVQYPCCDHCRSEEGGCDWFDRHVSPCRICPSAEGRGLTPMERDWPTIVAWTRHQSVSTDALVEELSLALDLLRERQTMSAPARKPS